MKFLAEEKLTGSLCESQLQPARRSVPHTMWCSPDTIRGLNHHCIVHVLNCCFESMMSCYWSATLPFPNFHHPLNMSSISPVDNCYNVVFITMCSLPPFRSQMAANMGAPRCRAMHCDWLWDTHFEANTNARPSKRWHVHNTCFQHFDFSWLACMFFVESLLF